jgi:transcriptional regulator with XRE-family HTH domain
MKTDDKSKKIIGDNLREIRHKRNIPQQEVADFLEIDRKTFADWESGKTDIKGSYISKLTEFLQVKANDLFQEKIGDIVINQHDNKDSLINGVVFIVADKESIEHLADVVKKISKKEL